jgi:uncharacterized membrane protein
MKLQNKKRCPVVATALMGAVLILIGVVTAVPANEQYVNAVKNDPKQTKERRAE